MRPERRCKSGMDGGLRAAVLLSPPLYLKTDDFLSNQWGPPQSSYTADVVEPSNDDPVPRTSAPAAKGKGRQEAGLYVFRLVVRWISLTTGLTRQLNVSGKWSTWRSKLLEQLGEIAQASPDLT